MRFGENVNFGYCYCNKCFSALNSTKKIRQTKQGNQPPPPPPPPKKKKKKKKKTTKKPKTKQLPPPKKKKTTKNQPQTTNNNPSKKKNKKKTEQKTTKQVKKKNPANYSNSMDKTAALIQFVYLLINRIVGLRLKWIIMTTGNFPVKKKMK